MTDLKSQIESTAAATEDNKLQVQSESMSRLEHFLNPIPPMARRLNNLRSLTDAGASFFAFEVVQDSARELAMQASHPLHPQDCGA